jgi:chemotaxis protein MotB
MSRRRKRKHEDHQNHEAWAIPYADLLTLLLAFFVVMYAISSVNEGKYRVLSDALFAAFRGTPRTMQPVQVGEKQVGSGADVKTTLVEQSMLEGQPRSMLAPVPLQTHLPKPTASAVPAPPSARAAAAAHSLEQVASEVLRAMDELVRANLVVVRRKPNLLEVEIRTDILFPSGSATLSASAVQVIERLAGALRPFPNPIRVEGHTDSRPINTLAFPSNWELSAGRAASVVHVFADHGITPERLAIIGLGEFSPAQSNATAEGRNANRRVIITVLATEGEPSQEVAGSLPPVAPDTTAAPDAAAAPSAQAAGDVATAHGTLPAL